MVMTMHALHALGVTVHGELDIKRYTTGSTVLASCLFSLMPKAAAFFLLNDVFSWPMETAQSLRQLQIAHSASFSSQPADATCLVILHVLQDILFMVPKHHTRHETCFTRDLSFTTSKPPNKSGRSCLAGYGSSERQGCGGDSHRGGP